MHRHPIGDGGKSIEVNLQKRWESAGALETLVGRNLLKLAKPAVGSLLEKAEREGGPSWARSILTASTSRCPTTGYFGGMSYLNGSDAVTNNGSADATLTEGGGDTTDSAYSGYISDGTHTTAITQTSGFLDITGTTNRYSGGTNLEGGTIEADYPFSLGTGTITMSGGTTLMFISDPSPDTIDGFTAGDNIDLFHSSPDPYGGAQLLANNVLQISGDGYTYDLNLNPSASYAGDYFHVAAGFGGQAIDITEMATPVLTIDNNSTIPIGAAEASDVAFTLTGLDAGDSGSVTFSDGSGIIADVAVNSNQTSYSANLSSLNDGTITSSLTITYNEVKPVAGNSVTLDQDLDEQAALALSVTNTDVGASKASSVRFTVAGLDSEDTGTVTFTDSNNKTVTVNVTGTQTSYTANLTTLADGTITSSLQVNPDPAGNTFTAVTGTSITLDQDTGEQAALALSVTIGEIDVTAASAIPFTLAGLDAEDTGTVTFTDAAGNKVTVGVNGAQTSYTANLTTLGPRSHRAQLPPIRAAWSHQALPGALPGSAISMAMATTTSCGATATARWRNG